jgi:hypothetical protein
MTLGRQQRQRPGGQVLDVVGMGVDRQDCRHGARLGQARRERYRRGGGVVNGGRLLTHLGRSQGLFSGAGRGRPLMGR